MSILGNLIDVKELVAEVSEVLVPAVVKAVQPIIDKAVSDLRAEFKPSGLVIHVTREQDS